MASEWVIRQRAIGRGREATTVAGGRGVRVRLGARLGTVVVAYSHGTGDHPEPYAIVDFDDGRRERIDLSQLSVA